MLRAEDAGQKRPQENDRTSGAIMASYLVTGSVSSRSNGVGWLNGTARCADKLAVHLWMTLSVTFWLTQWLTSEVDHSRLGLPAAATVVQR